MDLNATKVCHTHYVRSVTSSDQKGSYHSVFTFVPDPFLRGTDMKWRFHVHPKSTLQFCLLNSASVQMYVMRSQPSLAEFCLDFRCRRGFNVRDRNTVIREQLAITILAETCASYLTSYVIILFVPNKFLAGFHSMDPADNMPLLGFLSENVCIFICVGRWYCERATRSPTSQELTDTRVPGWLRAPEIWPPASPRRGARLSK